MSDRVDIVPENLKVQEAARLKGVSKEYLYQQIASGRLQAKRYGRTIRIPVAALDAWDRELNPST